MIYAIMLLFAATVGALIGIFCLTATASGEKYDGEMSALEHDAALMELAAMLTAGGEA